MFAYQMAWVTRALGLDVSPLLAGQRSQSRVKVPCTRIGRALEGLDRALWALGKTWKSCWGLGHVLNRGRTRGRRQIKDP